jgi:hypothetical protein
MARKPSPIFLERGSYRRRRMLDAVKLLVVLGACLWMIPVLWPEPDIEGTEPVALSDALFYIFGVWIFLTAVSAFLATRMRGTDPPNEVVGEDS